MYTRIFNSIRTQVLTKNMSTAHLDLEVNRLVWIDLEMTGLDIIKDKIMELACLITDSNLNIIAEAPRIVIQQPSLLLDNMDEWCTKQHGKSGLTEECRNSNITLAKAEETVLKFLKSHVTEKASPIAGNSVYMDRMFLKMYMPSVNEYLHYRIIDVSSIKELCRRWNNISSIKELCRRWNNDLYKQAPKKEFAHRALDDIKESVAELKYYKDCFFKTKT
ncbi:Exonuclease [Popillia japonica]|uniref:Exonuclease n=1 Tax=Popillia japonica TaxID=7064 RepID=A0AAW1NJB2_POPJA